MENGTQIAQGHQADQWENQDQIQIFWVSVQRLFCWAVFGSLQMKHDHDKHPVARV